MNNEDWYKEYEKQQAAARREFLVKNTAYGFAFGQLIGTSGYVLQTRRAGAPALAAGSFMGVCLAVGFLVRSL